MEPVNGGAVDETGIHSSSITQRVTDGTHCENLSNKENGKSKFGIQLSVKRKNSSHYHMKIGANSINEELP